MADRFELAYVYARVAGSLAASWVGERALELYRLPRLPELWQALFSEPPPPLPEALLYRETERRVMREALSEFRRLAASLRREEPFFLALRRKAEFSRVKRVLLALKGGEELCPEAEDPSLEPGFNAEAYPDLEAMFRGGRYAWIGAGSLERPAETENRLDRQFYLELWAECRRLRPALRKGLEELLLLEVELENLVWALRLAAYYKMDAEAIRPLLVELPGAEVTASAREALGLRRESREDWRGWKFEQLLDPPREGWSLDVRRLEYEARRLLYRRLKRCLHRHPFSYCPLYAFFKLLELETAVILALLEGRRLGAPVEEVAWLDLGGKGRIA